LRLDSSAGLVLPVTLRSPLLLAPLLLSPPLASHRFLRSLLLFLCTACLFSLGSLGLPVRLPPLSFCDQFAFLRSCAPPHGSTPSRTFFHTALSPPCIPHTIYYCLTSFPCVALGRTTFIDVLDALAWTHRRTAARASSAPCGGTFSLAVCCARFSCTARLNALAMDTRHCTRFWLDCLYSTSCISHCPLDTCHWNSLHSPGLPHKFTLLRHTPFCWFTWTFATTWTCTADCLFWVAALRCATFLRTHGRRHIFITTMDFYCRCVFTPFTRRFLCVLVGSGSGHLYTVRSFCTVHLVAVFATHSCWTWFSLLCSHHEPGRDYTTPFNSRRTTLHTIRTRSMPYHIHCFAAPWICGHRFLARFHGSGPRFWVHCWIWFLSRTWFLTFYLSGFIFSLHVLDGLTATTARSGYVRTFIFYLVYIFAIRTSPVLHHTSLGHILVSCITPLTHRTTFSYTTSSAHTPGSLPSLQFLSQDFSLHAMPVHLTCHLPPPPPSASLLVHLLCTAFWPFWVYLWFYMDLVHYIFTVCGLVHAHSPVSCTWFSRHTYHTAEKFRTFYITFATDASHGFPAHHCLDIFHLLHTSQTHCVWFCGLRAAHVLTLGSTHTPHSRGTAPPPILMDLVWFHYALVPVPVPRFHTARSGCPLRLVTLRTPHTVYSAAGLHGLRLLLRLLVLWFCSPLITALLFLARCTALHAILPGLLSPLDATTPFCLSCSSCPVSS